MKKGIVIGIILALIILGAVGYFAFYKTPSYNQTPTSIIPNTSSENLNSNTSTSNPSNSASKPVSVPKTWAITIMNFAFSPDMLTIKVGDSVTWTNQDSVTHQIISDSGAELSSDPLAKNTEYSRTFNVAGTYTYHCAIHPSMKGTIVVQ